MVRELRGVAGGFGVGKIMSDQLYKNQFVDPIDRDDSEVPVGTYQVYNFIRDYLGRIDKSTDINRASSAPLCPKRRWFQKNGFSCGDLTPRVLVNFTLGDLTEHTVKHFIIHGCVGPGKLYSEVDFGKQIGSFTIQNGKEIHLYAQDDLETTIGSFRVTAHADGWGKRNSDGKWELIEVKSAADYGYNRFKLGERPDYMKQAIVNLQTCRAKELGARDVRFFYLKKNTGHIWDRVYPFDEELAKEVVQDFITANQVEEPDAPYSPQPEIYYRKETGRRVLKYPCTYCPYAHHCQPAYTIEFKSGKPVHVIKEQT